MTKKQLEEIQNSINTVNVSTKLQNIKKEEYKNYKGLPSNHYEFLYLLLQTVKPKLVVELGTSTGLSMLYMIEGSPNSDFYTIDIDVNSGLYLKDVPATYIIGDSIECVSQIPNDIDILFEDTSHEYDTIERDFQTYFPKIKKGGIMLFDDINSNAYPGAKKWWKELDCPIKVELPKIHLRYGLGAIIKNY